MIIGINAGHTLKGPGSGAVGALNESYETRRVASELERLCRANGHKAINCTVDAAFTRNAYLRKAVNIANENKLDLFISIHFNQTKGAEGTETFTYAAKSYKEAVDICSNISELGFRNRGIKNGSNLYVVRKTKAKAFLIEVCFVDDPDASQYRKVGPEAIAEAIYKGITGDKAVEKPTEKPSKETVNVDGLWGPGTTRLAQKVFKTPVDGKVSNQYQLYAGRNPGLLSSTFDWERNPGKNGSVLIKAIQKKVGVKADGYIGPGTIKAMQRWLGTPVDGKCSKPSVMIKEFQKWLNRQ